MCTHGLKDNAPEQSAENGYIITVWWALFNGLLSLFTGIFNEQIKQSHAILSTPE